MPFGFVENGVDEDSVDNNGDLGRWIEMMSSSKPCIRIATGD